MTAQCCRNPEHFNPLPPHGGRLAVCHAFSPLCHPFQSTPSAWRETTPLTVLIAVAPFQSTPSAWRETSFSSDAAGTFVFQSTPSAWRETQERWEHGRIYDISIHSLRMEGDSSHVRQNGHRCRNFNPLPPHGGRPNFSLKLGGWQDISIHSLRMEGDL